MKQQEFEEIFSLSFGDSAAWKKWFFSHVVNEDLIMLGGETAGKNASALLMQPYDFLYAGRLVPSAYISCVATRPQFRARGAASALMKEALAEARSKGIALCELIPAEDHLYFFYDRLGFATVFYSDYLRFTSAHAFAGGKGEEVAPSAAMLARLERKFGCGVMHSEADYRNILDDLTLDGNPNVIAVADGADEAMLFATSDASNVNVKLMLATSREVGNMALGLLRRREPGKTFEVSTPPLSGEKAYMRARGMGRIVNPLVMLQALASAHPMLEYSLLLHDDIIPENSGVYVIEGGSCRQEPVTAHVKADVELTPATLTALLFSSHCIGNIFSLPARRPLMALMLD